MKGFSGEVIESTIHQLRRAGLLDDLALARGLKREAIRNRLLSRSGARFFLVRRGIPKNLVDVVIDGDDRSDFENALRLADKKIAALGRYPAEIAKRRLYGLLSRRGYAPETIRKVLKHTIRAKEDEP